MCALHFEKQLGTYDAFRGIAYCEKGPADISKQLPDWVPGSILFPVFGQLRE